MSGQDRTPRLLRRGFLFYGCHVKLTISLLQDLRPLRDRARPVADIVVLPELADGGYAALADGQPPHTEGDSYLSSLQELSMKRDIVLVGGSTRLKSRGGACTNTSLTFHRGKCIHRYDKIHLFHPTGDHRYFVPGKKASVFRAAIGAHRLRIGVVICFDLRFPELMRSLAFRGMDLLIVPARWPARRAEAWKTLLRARAIENQAFVVGCNASGIEGGPSFVFGPSGAPVPAIVRGNGTPAKRFTLDFDEIARAKKLYDGVKEARWKRGR